MWAKVSEVKFSIMILMEIYDWKEVVHPQRDPVATRLRQEQCINEHFPILYATNSLGIDSPSSQTNSNTK